MTTEQKRGYDIAKGAATYFAQYLMWGLLIVGAFTLLRNSGGYGLDDTDRDGWNRSGLTLHTDAKTGVQYLSDGKGGLTRREAR